MAGGGLNQRIESPQPQLLDQSFIFFDYFWSIKFSWFRATIMPFKVWIDIDLQCWKMPSGPGPAPGRKLAHNFAGGCFSNINCAGRLPEMPTLLDDWSSSSSLILWSYERCKGNLIVFFLSNTFKKSWYCMKSFFLIFFKFNADILFIYRLSSSKIFNILVISLTVNKKILMSLFLASLW